MTGKNLTGGDTFDIFQKIGDTFDIFSKVNDEFHKWLEEKYGSDNIGHVEESHGKVHDYLGMKLDYTERGKLNIDMRNYLDSVINEFPYELPENVKCPWTEKLFKVDINAKKLGDYKKKSRYKGSVNPDIGVFQNMAYSLCQKKSKKYWNSYKKEY